jgi:triacylglycerol esterase/lipase EstA (alpha/beta hydrolase family)
MRRTLTRFLLAALSALTIALLGLAPARAATPLPVNYNFLGGATTTALQVGANPPGANDWNCRPSAAHPEPVVLVHGLMANQADNWQMAAPLLKNNGYCVFALTYGTNDSWPAPFNTQIGAIGQMQASAAQVGTFVDKVLGATGAAKVDIVGHSEGTIVPDYYAKYLGGANKIDKFVALAPIRHGTNLLGTGTLEELAAVFGLTGAINQLVGTLGAPALVQFGQGSDFIAALRAGGTAKVPGIDYTSIVTRYDELVTPYTSGIEPGMTNIVLQNVCPLDFSDHLEIASSPTSAQLILNALDPAHPKPIPCGLVLPVIGK